MVLGLGFVGTNHLRRDDRVNLGFRDSRSNWAMQQISGFVVGNLFPTISDMFLRLFTKVVDF